jgi:hypothetical protein
MKNITNPITNYYYQLLISSVSPVIEILNNCLIFTQLYPIDSAIYHAVADKYWQRCKII